MKVNGNAVKPGMIVEHKGELWSVTKSQSVKPGKGGAFVRTKLKSVQGGNVIEKTFRAGEMVPQALLEKSTLQHTYMEAGDFVWTGTPKGVGPMSPGDVINAWMKNSDGETISVLNAVCE